MRADPTLGQRTSSTRLLRTALRIALACLLAVPVALFTTPAAAAPQCGPAGESLPAEAFWPLRRLEPDAAWPLSRGRGVLVAVIDSGVSATHPVLAGRVHPGRDIGLPNHSGQCDEDGHGTMVAAIIAGRDDTSDPFSGIAPDARILPIRVLQERGFTKDPGIPDRVATAIEYAVAQGAKVINLSLQTDIPTQALERAVAHAREKDVVIVAAGGNVLGGQQANQPVYPAAYPGVIGVGGVGEQSNHVDSSISGPFIDVAAPGFNIAAPAPRGKGYLIAEAGTSYAAAYVSGVAALVRARYPQLNAEQVAHRVIRTADSPPEGRNDQVGYGVVNPYRAVAAVLGQRSNPPIDALNPPPVAPDSLATARVVAISSAVVGVLLALTLLIGRPIIRRGRRRGWRPGRRPGPEPTS